MNSDQTSFLYVCQLFEQLNQITGSVKRTSNDTEEGTAIYLTKNMKKQVYHTISQWFNHFTSGSLLMVFRLLVPEEDVKRTYFLKERRLAQLLVKVLGLEASNRCKVLIDWRRLSEESDLSSCIFNLISDCEHAMESKITIGQVNTLLDDLSSVGKSSLGKDMKGLSAILSQIYLPMTSLECKWITRIILKNLGLCVDPKFYFDSFHGWMFKVYQMRNDLEMTCKTILQMIKDGYSSSKLTTENISFASIAHTYFKPELGTNIAVMECGRGKGIQHVCDHFMGKVVYVETKYDGERLQAHLWNGGKDLRIYSKSGRDSTERRLACNSYLLDSLRPSSDEKVQDIILEGELLVYNEITQQIERFGTVQDFGRSQVKNQNILLGRRHLLLILYDILYLNGESLMRRPLNERKRLLNLLITPIPNYIQISPVTLINFKYNTSEASAELKSLYMDCLYRREEGLIVKSADSYYIPGNRSEWLKLKQDYIEGFGDTADFAVIGATRRIGSDLLDNFLVACLVNKREIESNPLLIPNFQGIFSVSLGLNRGELELLQMILMNRSESDPQCLGYEFSFARGFCMEIDFWLKDPLVFELLSSGFIRDRGMWSYSLRFPRIKRIKMDCTFMECVTFQELQQMGKESLVPIHGNYSDEDKKNCIETKLSECDTKAPEKRVRFNFFKEGRNTENVHYSKHVKTDFFFCISKKIKLQDRRQIVDYFAEGGIEIIWSLPAALKYSKRKIIFISEAEDEKNIEELEGGEKVEKIIKIPSTCTPLEFIKEKFIIDKTYFSICL